MVRGLIGVADSGKATEIAEIIYRGFVEELKVHAPESYGIPTHLQTSFSAKVRLYREAIILFVLRTMAEKDNDMKNCSQGLKLWFSLWMQMMLV